ncbi:MAG: ribbon-helix-helix protein, CopG family [Acidimicrobiales bacterium]
MTKRHAPAVTTETPIGPDVDLEREDVRLVDGTRLTPEVAEAIVEEVRRGGGRPSLSGAPARSPQIAFRVPPEVRDRAERAAADEGKTISQFAREALEARLDAAS